MLETVIDLLKYLIPSIATLIGIVIVLNKIQLKQDRHERFETRRETIAKIIPLRLNAYERAILFLERISPENLIVRCDGNGKNAKLFQTQLVLEVQAEYEHNLTQQVYISIEGWYQLARAKDQVIALINQSLEKVGPGATGNQLGGMVLQTMMEEEMHPAKDAIKVLKSDIAKMFRF